MKSLSLFLKYLLQAVFVLFTISCDAQSKSKPDESAHAKDYGQLLIGTWQSTSDPRFIVKIDGKFYHEIYKNTPPSILKYTITNTCSCDAKHTLTEKTLLVTYEEDPTDCYCYSITKLDSKNLIMTYIGRGNSLSFKKIK